MIALAVLSLERDGIEGALAEVGVYRGETSKLLHALAPERNLYLFDTFAGFPSGDLERQADARFKDTSVEIVRRAIGDTTGVHIREGYFPETTIGLEGERFAFVLLDVDLYKPTIAALEFFYPRLASGGYIFGDDYNSGESDKAICRAFTAFFRDKGDRLVEMPDKWGSVVLRKP
jgi:O-methyltransferase